MINLKKEKIEKTKDEVHTKKTQNTDHYKVKKD